MADYELTSVASGAELDTAIGLAGTALQPGYVSALPAATDLTGAVIPIVQGGVNKQANAWLVGKPTLDQIAGLNPTLDLDFANQVYRHYSPATGLREKALSDIVTFTRASSATYFDAKGVMQTASSDEPRIDFDPVTGECKGLLIEESRVNSFLNSLIDGTSLSTQTVTVTAAPWTISYYGTGSITLSGAHVATITGTSNTALTALTFTPTAGSLVCTVSGTVKWAQCELGGFATSFIPTAGATVTRAVDVAVISGTAFSDFYRTAAGSMIASAWRYILAGYVWCLFVDSNNRIQQYGHATGARFESDVRVSGVSHVALSDSNSPPIGSRFISSVSMQGGDVVEVINGSLLTRSAQPPSLPPVTELRIGAYTATANLWNGPIARLAYFPVSLSNGTLQQLTAG